MREDGVQDLQRQVQQTDACVRKSQSTVLEEGSTSRTRVAAILHASMVQGLRGTRLAL